MGTNLRTGVVRIIDIRNIKEMRMIEFDKLKTVGRFLLYCRILDIQVGNISENNVGTSGISGRAICLQTSVDLLCDNVITNLAHSSSISDLRVSRSR